MWSIRSSHPVRPGSRLAPRGVDHPQNDSRSALLQRLGLLCVVTMFGVSTRSSSGTVSFIAQRPPSMESAPARLQPAEFVPILRRTGGEIRLASLVEVQPSTGTQQEDCPVRSADFTDDTAGRLVGSWEDDYYGRRVMTLRPDGSGTMLVELKGPAKLIVGSKLTFQVEWSAKDGRLDIHTIGGEPANKVAMITRAYGDRAVQDILDLTATELSVRDTDDGDEFLWRRLQPTPVAAH
jgi:hypothetical protein